MNNQWKLFKFKNVYSESTSEYVYLNKNQNMKTMPRFPPEKKNQSFKYLEKIEDMNDRIVLSHI